MSEKRPWLRAAAWLAFLGPFFFATYGFANWLASRRADVTAVAFEWERLIPFLPWTIIPYWSIDLLYAISPFVCRTRREVDRHGQQLLFVQVVSILFFIAFPLRFSFGRPDTSGVFGALFTALGSFDKPFNQAPSLHIGLLIVIWSRLAAHVTRPAWRWFLHGWMTLIGVSVLTTFQHHFVDIPTGLAVGFLALWVLPDEEASPLVSAKLTSDPTRRRLAGIYSAGAVACAVVALFGGVWLWFFWVTLTLGVVAMIYAFFGARGFQKTGNGQLSLGARGLLAPYLAFAWLNSRMWTRSHPQPAEVTDGVWIGRMPSERDLTAFSSVVDLAAELSCPGTAGLSYRSVCVLDLTVPDAKALREAATAIDAARQHGPVLVCCALGYSRSAAAVSAWLLSTSRAANVSEAMEIVRRARPSIVLRDEHRRALQALG